jgi:thiol-disulfide isomerase/thioredoxin
MKGGMLLRKLSLSKMQKNLQKRMAFLMRGNNMNKVLLLLGLLFVLYILYNKYLAKEGMECKAENFKSEISGDGVEGRQLVMFYADWCGHCNSMKPIWKEVSDEVEAKNNNETDESKKVKMLKVNCGDDKPEHKDIRETYGVSGFPTIKLFENGKETGEFKGERTKEGLLQFLGF